MKYANSPGFTLIELMISITIFLILTTMTYVNYANYQNIAKVKLSLKEVSQSIHDARNMAINGYDRNMVNQSVWIYFNIQTETIQYYGYNFNSWITLSEWNLIKEKKLQEGMKVTNLSWNDAIMIHFSSIYGVPTIYSFSQSGEKQEFSWEIVEIGLSYKWIQNYPFKRDLKYFKNTNVVDY